jgi:DNA replication protein
MAFSGFPKNVLSTAVPAPLFNSLLEEIEDIAELRVTLRGLWLLDQKRTLPRMVAREEFLNDRVLRRSFQVSSGSPIKEIERGLELAVGRGTLLLYQPQSRNGETSFYLLNTEGGRRDLSKLRRGVTVLPKDISEPYDGDVEEAADKESNIFALYEDNIGMLSPILSEQLKEAEERYPWPWIVQAFKIAIHQNKRSWAYISAILRRWSAEGKNDGELGRHSPKDDRQKYLDDYQRRWEQSGDKR